MATRVGTLWTKGFVFCFFSCTCHSSPLRMRQRQYNGKTVINGSQKTGSLLSFGPRPRHLRSFVTLQVASLIRGVSEALTTRRPIIFAGSCAHAHAD